MKYLLLISIFLIGCSDESIHDYAVDQPSRHDDYLAYVVIEKTGFSDELPTYELYSWEVLQYNPNMAAFPKWNTMHFEPWKVTVLYWTELPSDPIGDSFYSTSGGINPPSEN